MDFHCETHRSAALLRKTRIFALIVIFSNVLGNSLLGVGLHQIGSLLGKPPAAYVTALFNPYAAAGVALLIVWMITHMMLLSWADLSYVLPLTSLGYVLTAVAGRVFLHETVSWTRWMGVCVIVLGFSLVSRTSPASAPAKKKAAPVPDRELVLQ